jgi:hypothetical protein
VKIKDGKFACEACGKRYAWKPQLAGKRAKCSCGAAMVVPQAESTEADAPDDLYGFVEESLPPPPAARSMPMPSAPIASVAGGAQPSAGAIGYRSAPTKENTARDRFSFDAMTHPPRDLYIPVALLIVGILGIIAWAISWGAGAGTMAVVLLVTGVATLVKTAVLIGLAFIFAPMAGVSFGDARTAILKFAAIVVFTDAVGMWFDELVEMAGGMPTGRRGRGRIFWLEMFLIAGLISAMCYYLFDMDSEDTGTFAIPFAVISRILDWILGIVVAGVLAGILSAATATPPAAVTAAPAPPAPTPAPPGATSSPPVAAAPAAPPGIPLQANARDREIERMVGGGLGVKDALEYNQSQPQKSKREPQLINEFYGAGAKRVYFDLGGSRAIVQLPDDAFNRAKCFELAAAHRASKGIQGAAPKEEGQRFLEVELAKAGERPRGR